MKTAPSLPARPAPPRAQGGFTLIEMMVTLGVAGIFIAVAAPSMSSTVRGNRIQSEAASLVTDLQLARTEAVRRGQTVSVCPSSDGATCTGTNGWQSGWIVFSDPASTRTPSGAPLRVRAAFKGGDTFVASPSTTAVSFNREGFTSNLGTAAVTFAVRSPDKVSGLTRCVRVDIGGRLRTQKNGEGACS